LHPQKDAFLCWTILFGPYALFYIGTWEEYFTGALIMPIINGPSEGLLGGALMSLTSWYYGSQFWHQHTWWTNLLQPHLSKIMPSLADVMLRNCDILVAISLIGFFQEVVTKVSSVGRQYGTQVLCNLLPFATLIACSTTICHFNINIWLQAPRVCLHLCAVLFVEMTTALMLSHMSQETYQWLRWPLVPLVVFAAALGLGYTTDTRSCIDFLLIYVSSIAAYLSFKFVIIIQEICTLLNIWCFDITTPRKRQFVTANPSQHSVVSTNHRVKVE